MSLGRRWSDLRPRLLSGLVMAAIGVLAVWLGGPWFAALAAVAAGLMLWELAGMMGARRQAAPLGVLAAAAVAVPLWYPASWALALLLVPPALGAAMVARDKTVFLLYGLAVLIAAHVLVGFLIRFGPLWLVWLILVVVATDIFGYFAGRLLGGPKFWPRISPKKTWSGTVAGWIAAALIGAAFGYAAGATGELALISAVVAFASQLGDIAESAIKRRMGEKDSSHLIPGHGGLLDRFDGLMGATLAMLLITEVVVVPVVGF